MKKIKVLNLEIDNLSQSEFLADLESGIVFTPNVDHLMKLQHDSDFVQAYGISNYKVCDSQILLYAAKFLGTPIKEKISGSDLLPAFCNYHKHHEHIKIFLLGAREGIARQAQQKINYKIGRKIVVDSYSPSFGFENNEQECRQIINMINQSDATVLVIGVGAPKQEKWIYKYREQLPNIKIFMALGATIDFEAGKLQRSPKWISQIGLEWLFRLYCEPKRLWKRYLVENLPFLFLIVQQKFNFYSHKKKKQNRNFWKMADKF
ncbi:WecB/TagA/CpsF family glycosyltransferase [Calothrix sp. UHCC 0171]|uniref:WecB/TagA/CpsF family glycosyltransferase n=1 Tax=Calothrix sp. UHCC 0171 TaxID=3110245 RepID=UPI002B204AF7|nr:WecB/TagA/CpsF family glycosyltransferase [Calothrix sp. UHCC 0171]MEA5570620.1 WecB/TagA/CpsF family glycosyltransferase [Calothrix sp. UHCC 0171]